MRRNPTSFNQSRVVVKTSSSQINTHSKGKSMAQLQQCQSRIQSRVSTVGNRNDRDVEEQLIRKKQQQTESMEQWLQTYQQFNSTIKSVNNFQMHDLLQKYNYSQRNFQYYKISILKVANIPSIDSKYANTNNRTKYSPSKNSNNKFNSQQNYTKKYQTYLQIDAYLVECNLLNQAGQYIEQDMKSTYYSSEYIKLEDSSIRNRHQMNQNIDLYFYIHKKDHHFYQSTQFFDKFIGLKMIFYTILLQKGKKFNCVIEKVAVGSILINLQHKNKYQSMYFLNTAVQGFYDPIHNQQQNKNQNNKKSDQYAQIQIKQSDQFDLMAKILIPYRIYTQQSKVACLNKQKFPQSLTNIQKIRFYSRPYNLNFQLISLFISNSIIFNAMNIYENSIKLRFQQISKIQQIEIKQYRMVVCCHNGQKVLSSTNFQLKKQNPKTNKIVQKKSRNSLSSKSNIRQKQTKNGIKQTDKQNHQQLFTDKLATLDFAFNAQGIIILCQIYCRIQIKIHLRQTQRPLLESTMLPIAYFIKPVISLENDVKNIQNLYLGQFISHKGLTNYFEQYNQRQQQQIAIKMSKVGPSKNRLQSFSRISSKVQSIAQSTVQFYIYKQESQSFSNKNYSTITQSILNDNLSQSMGLNKSAIGNQMNKLLMQKARIYRQRQKLKQKMNRINLELNRKIPLLDTTQLKMQIYQQKLSKIKQDKYELKSTLGYLKNKIQEFQRQEKIKNQLIEDTLKITSPENKYYNQKDLNLPRSFINAKGGVVNRKQDTQINQNYLQEYAQNSMIIPPNQHEIKFSLNSQNIDKIVNKLFPNANYNQTAQLTFLQIQVQSLQIFNLLKKQNCLSQMRQFDIYSGFQVFKKVYFSKDTFENTRTKVNEVQNKGIQNLLPSIKLRIQLPKTLSSNLLISFLFAPFCLYFVNSQTRSLIGVSFIYLTSLCNQIVSKSSMTLAGLINQIIKSPKTYFIFNKSQIKGKIIVKSINLSKSQQSVKDERNSNIPNSTDSISQIQTRLQLRKQPEQKRKLMRIQNFKRASKIAQEDQNNAIKLKSIQAQKKKKEQAIKQTLSRMNGHQIKIFYNRMNFNLIKIQLENNTSQVKNYSISIKDQDKQYYQQQQSIQQNQLNIINNPLLLQNGQNPVLMNEETNRLYLNPNSKGILLMTYNSLRKIFCQRINKILINNLQYENDDNPSDQHSRLNNQQKQMQNFLFDFNHKHNISMTIASQTGLQKIINIEIQPQVDFNLIKIPYYLQDSSNVFIPLPHIKDVNLKNIYFQNNKFQLVQTQNNRIFLNGYAPQLNKVSLVQVLIYPHPSYPSLFKQLQNQYSQIKEDDNKNKQIIRKLMSSEKILNLSFQIWGCRKILQMEIRLFDQIDILWQINNDDIFYRSKGEDQFTTVYLSTNHPQISGFRSLKNPNKIQSYKKITVNKSQKKTLVKSVVSSNKMGQNQILIQVQHQRNRQNILTRYIIETLTSQVEAQEQLLFEIELEKIQQILFKAQKKQNKEEYKIKQNSILNQFFYIDASSLFSLNESKEKIKELITNNQLNLRSSSIFMSVKHIQLVEDENQIKELIKQKQKNLKNIRNTFQQDYEDDKIHINRKKKTQESLADQLQLFSKKQIKSKKKIQQKPENKSKKDLNKQPHSRYRWILKVQLQVDTELLTQTLKINFLHSKSSQDTNQVSNNAKSKQIAQKPNIFQQLILSTVQFNNYEASTSLIQSIIGVKHKQKILYWNIKVIQKVQKDKQMIIKSILQKYSKNKNNKNLNKNNQDKELVNEQNLNPKNYHSPSNKLGLKNFYFNQ